jgi:hypothetical protein
MKNVRFEVRAREELREALFGAFLLVFFIALVVCPFIYWTAYGDSLGLREAIICASKTVIIVYFGGIGAYFSGSHALERGKVAVHYYARLAKHPVAVGGQR